MTSLYSGLLTLMFVLRNFSMAKENQIDRLSWLLGTWEETTPKGKIYETWIKRSETEFYGASYKLKNADTIFIEKVKLVEENGLLYYIPTVTNQNNGRPVRFYQKSFTESEISFENQEHDFPQLISYRQIGNDSAVAEISGNQNGKPRSEVFPMKRIN